MRTILSFIHQNSLSGKLRLRMRLIGPLSLLIAAAVIFASSGKARIAYTSAAMPGLRGEAATEYLKQEGLYSSLVEAVKAAGSGARIRMDDRGASYQASIDRTFTQIKKLTPSDGSNWFGVVAVYGNTAIVGANEAIGRNVVQGSAYIFERNKGGANNWGFVKKLTASDGANFDGFGDSVAIYGDTAIVGANEAIGSNNEQGAVYIFERNKGGANNWGVVKKLTASDGAEHDAFGSSLAIYGDTAMVGANGDAIGINEGQGSAYIFERNKGGANNWGVVKKLTASAGAKFDGFGGSVAIYGDTAIVGASHAKTGSNNKQGSAYVFLPRTLSR